MQTVQRAGALPVSAGDVAAAVQELAGLVEADGAALRLVGVVESAVRVTVAVEFPDVACMECVLPPDELRSVIEAGLSRRLGEPCDVVLVDPRMAAPPAAPLSSGTRLVLDPRGVVHDGAAGAGPEAGPLAGKRVGFRVDVLWPAWDLVVDEWSAALESAGATTATWRRMQGLVGDEAKAKQAEYKDFLLSLDVAVVGLGNCGGCTLYTVEDALSALDAGLPTVAVATAHFETLARSLAAHHHRPELRLTILPYPLHSLPEPEVRAAARAALPDLLATAGATV